jgi:hypothetical protein
MPADTARAGAFLAGLDSLWDDQGRQRSMVAERLPQLQQLARRTVPLALAVIGAGPGTGSLAAGRTGEDLANPPVAF